MPKIHVLDICEFCNGEAYMFIGEDVDARGDTFDRYQPCEMCHGSGNRSKWLGFREFSSILEYFTALEPN